MGPKKEHIKVFLLRDREQKGELIAEVKYDDLPSSRKYLKVAEFNIDLWF